MDSDSMIRLTHVIDAIVQYPELNIYIYVSDELLMERRQSKSQQSAHRPEPSVLNLQSLCGYVASTPSSACSCLCLLGPRGRARYIRLIDLLNQ